MATAPTNNRRAAITVAATVVSVVVFAVTVLGLTGVLTGKGGVRRSPDSAPLEVVRHWYRLDISLMAHGLPEIPAAPVLLAIDNDGSASVVNGREELAARAVRDDGRFDLELPDSGTRAAMTPEGQRYVGTLSLALGGGRVEALPVTATPLIEGLPELRFPKAPDRPEARIRDADLSHVWAVTLSADGVSETGRMVVFVADSGELQLSINTRGADFGTLAGRQFGRLAMASTLADYTLTVVALELSEDGEQLTGSLSAVGRPALTLHGTRQDRVDVPEVASCGPPPPGAGPALVLQLDPETRPSLDALRFAAEATRRGQLLPVRVSATGGAPDALKALGERYGLPITAAEGARARTCVWVLDRAGQVVDQSGEFPSAYAGGRSLAARLTTAVRSVAPPPSARPGAAEGAGGVPASTPPAP